MAGGPLLLLLGLGARGCGTKLLSNEILLDGEGRCVPWRPEFGRACMVAGRARCAPEPEALFCSSERCGFWCRTMRAPEAEP